ncbi:MAG: hypothetical protein ACK2UX_13595 [Anaerolineae bacterium]|jgi:hypothetical protein
MARFDPTKMDKRWMLWAILVALLAWSAMWSVIQLPVNTLTKVLFFVALLVGISATLMPAIAYLNARFGRFQSKRVYQVRFARQSLFSGALVVVVAWLQMQRSLSPTLALIVVAVFILTETFLITREAPADGS